jgi:hypothetical protein
VLYRPGGGELADDNLSFTPDNPWTGGDRRWTTAPQRVSHKDSVLVAEVLKREYVSPPRHWRMCGVVQGGSPSLTSCKLALDWVSPMIQLDELVKGHVRMQRLGLVRGPGWSGAVEKPLFDSRDAGVPWTVVRYTAAI